MPGSTITLSVYTWVGVEFSTLVNGRIFGLSIYENSGSDASVMCLLWDKGLIIPLAAKEAKQISPTPSGWLNCWFNRTVRVTSGTLLRFAFLKTQHFLRITTGLATPQVHGNIKFWSSFQNTSINPIQAAISTNTNLNGVDILFQPD